MCPPLDPSLEPPERPARPADRTDGARRAVRVFTTRASGTELQLAAPLRAELARHVCAGYPHEACGALIGARTGGLLHVTRVLPARNRARARDRYELEPADLLRAEEQAQAAGLEVLGIWHSHPDRPAEPSATDRDAAWEGWSYLILAVTAGGVGGLRCWRLEAGVFHEERVLP